MSNMVGALVIALTVAFVDASVSIHDVTLILGDAEYVGPCPVTLTFTVAMDGDPKTIFGYRLIGDGATSKKTLYGFIPPEGTVSMNQDIVIDATHAGAHYMQAEVKYSSEPLGQDLKDVIDSDKVNYTVTCISASPSPGQRVRR